MSNRTCKYCKKIFTYPYLLKKHNNAIIKCLPVFNNTIINNSILDTDINVNSITVDNIAIDNTTNKINNDLICKYCNKKYSNKYNLVRHEKNCKCNKLQMNQTNNNSNENKIIITNDVNKNIIELINKLSERLDKLYEIVINNNIIKNDKIENSKNIIHENIKYDNHIELNNSNNNNKTIINNQTIINNNKIIYPYGYENLNHLTKLQMLDILKSRNSVILVLESVYSILENKNYHKRNLNKNTITAIDKDTGIKIYDENDFKNNLLNHSIFLLKRIFSLCRDSLSINNQILIWKKIKLLDIEDNKELNLNFISRLIELNSEKNIKHLFNDFKNNITSENCNKNGIELINKITDEITNLKNNINKVNISKEILTENIKQIENDKLDMENELNDITSIYIKDTARYKAMLELEENEINYLSKINPSIGDIDELASIQFNRNSKEYNIMKLKITDGRFDLSDEKQTDIMKELYDVIKQEPINKIISCVGKIKFNKELKNELKMI